MPSLTPRPRSRSLRAAALLAVSTLVLTACGGKDEEAAQASKTPTTQPTPSTTVEVPETTDITAPGTKLKFGRTATVAYEAGDQGTVLGLTVDSAEQGSLDDLRGFNLDEPYKKRGNYYYVRVTVRNKGKEKVSDLPVPLRGMSGENTLLPAVVFTSSFKKCPTEKLPKNFKPGAKFKTCLVFLSPNKGSLEGVSYRPTDEYVAIEWHGKVKLLPKPKAKKKGKGR